MESMSSDSKNLPAQCRTCRCFWILLSLVMALSFFQPSIAAAEESDERARELHEQGRALFESGQYDQCILLWREALELSNRAGLHFNLAEAEERAERFAEAAASLERYLASGERHAQANRVSINRRIAQLERQAAAAVVTGVLTLTRTSDLEEACGGTICTDEHQADWDTAWSLAITTDVLIGLASASAIATILLIFLENRSQRRSTATIAPWMGPGQAGLTTTFDF